MATDKEVLEAAAKAAAYILRLEGNLDAEHLATIKLEAENTKLRNDMEFLLRTITTLRRGWKHLHPPLEQRLAGLQGEKE